VSTLADALAPAGPWYRCARRAPAARSHPPGRHDGTSNRQ